MKPRLILTTASALIGLVRAQTPTCFAPGNEHDIECRERQEKMASLWPSVFVRAGRNKLTFDKSLDCAEYTSDASLNLLMITVRLIASTRYGEPRLSQGMLAEIASLEDFVGCKSSNLVFNYDPVQSLHSDVAGKVKNREFLTIDEIHQVFVRCPRLILADKGLYKMFFQMVASIYITGPSTDEASFLAQREGGRPEYRVFNGYKDLCRFKDLFGSHVNALSHHYDLPLDDQGRWRDSSNSIEERQEKMMSLWPSVFAKVGGDGLIFNKSLDCLEYTSDTSLNLLMITVRLIASTRCGGSRPFKDLLAEAVSLRGVVGRKSSNSVFNRDAMRLLHPGLVDEVKSHAPLMVDGMHHIFVLSPRVILADEVLYEMFFRMVASIYITGFPSNEAFFLAQRESEKPEYGVFNNYEDLCRFKDLFGSHVGALSHCYDLLPAE